MAVVEVAADLGDVWGATGVEGELQTHVRDEVVESLLAVEGRARQGEGEGTGVLDVQRERRTDVANGGVRDGTEAGSVGPLGSPVR